MHKLRQHLGCLLMGLGMALMCAWMGELLTPPAIARWKVQMQEGEELCAFFALIGVRHLPLFLIAVACGNCIYRVVKGSSLSLVAAATLPYLIYVTTKGTMDSIGAGESALSWMSYEPAYFIWPHFVAVPFGLLAAGRMVDRLNKKVDHDV